MVFPRKKSAFILGVSLLIVVAAVSVGLYKKPPAPPPRIWRIGVVLNPPTLDHIWEGFREGMRELGYEEGKNVEYKTVAQAGSYQETKVRVAGLIDQGIDLLYPLGVHPTRAAKEISEERRISLPILFGILADPVGLGIVRDLKNSGNNLTGISSGNEFISSKRLELFLEMAQSVTRVVFPWNDPKTTGIERFRKTAQDLGVEVTEQHVKTVEELDLFLSSFSFRKGDGLFRATDSITAPRAREMALLALEKKIPLSGTNIFDVEHGALMSYGADYRRMGRQAARLAHRILAEGVAPSDLPIELPEALELIVNLKTAEEIGLAVSAEFLSRAHRIIR